MRAVADDRDLAESSGIDVDRSHRADLGRWRPGWPRLGGIFYGLNESVSYDMGSRILLLLFAAVVLGGPRHGVRGHGGRLHRRDRGRDKHTTTSLQAEARVRTRHPDHHAAGPSAGHLREQGEDRLMDLMQILAAGVLAMIGPITAGYALKCDRVEPQVRDICRTAQLRLRRLHDGRRLRHRHNGRFRRAAVAGLGRRCRRRDPARAPARNPHPTTAGRLLRHHIDRRGRSASVDDTVVICGGL